MTAHQDRRARRTLMLFSGPGPSRAGRGGRPEHLGIDGHPDVAVRLRQRRDLRPLRGVGARLRRVRPAEPQRADQQVGHGAADHGRRAQARLGQADHRRHAVLPLRPPGQEAPRPRADLRPADRRPVQDRRRRPADGGRPAHRPDPGLLRRPGRPPVRAAAARRLRRGTRRRGEVTVVSPDAGRVRVAERGPTARRCPLAIIHKTPRPDASERGEGESRRRRRRGPHLHPRRRHDRHRRHDREGRRGAASRTAPPTSSSPRPTRCSPAPPSTG